MRLRLHVGPHRTGAGYLQEAAHRNRERLARAGVLFLNEPARHSRVAEALEGLRADIALQQIEKLAAQRREELGSAHPQPSLLYVSDRFFDAQDERAKYEHAFRQLAAALAQRGYEVELVFVERDIEEVLTANALHQASVGNLQFVTPETAPYLRYLEAYAWKKAFFFAGCKVVHLDHGHLTRSGEMLANYLKLAYGLEVPGLELPDGVDALDLQDDAQIARGLVMAPMINWLEQFGSLPRAQLLDAPAPLQPHVSGESWNAVVANVSLLRDCVRGTSRRALDLFMQARAAAAAE